MKTFKLICHRAIGPIQFGMTKQQVFEVLGEPDVVVGHHYGFLGGLFVHFDASSKVEFIEATASEQYEVLFDGVDVHRRLAVEVIEVALQQDTFDAQDPDLGHAYVFNRLGLSFWRSVIPESFDGEGRYFDSVAIKAH
ncbi:hypothetical protein [Vibrio sp. SCSIO 43136]|uniref:hypothetical protein n=1 Tax=Vibrio sp. SCSIO 43136 TaxID=2819101 RepID=UPI0020758CFE|nr:hypothetical protein [Vibrio sp. SCSIO 43136]USD64278.1 hypothetical protein J4N39_09165 [Vibrio sp. SCSIO 43136]